MRPMITQANHPVNHQVMNKKISLDMRVKDMVTSEEDSTKKENSCVQFSSYCLLVSLFWSAEDAKKPIEEEEKPNCNWFNNLNNNRSHKTHKLDTFNSPKNNSMPYNPNNNNNNNNNQLLLVFLSHNNNPNKDLSTFHNNSKSNKSNMPHKL